MIGRSLTTLVLALLGALWLGCAQDPSNQPPQPTQITTLESTPTKLKPIRTPKRIEFDQGPAPAESEDGEPAAEASEVKSTQWTQNLPFTPKIAMDPVDGSKLSIRADTPIAEYKGRIYYFSSEANRMQFIRNPEDYLSGTFASY